MTEKNIDALKKRLLERSLMLQKNTSQDAGQYHR